MIKYQLDFYGLETKNDVHQYLKKMLRFPDYYGANLDALYDCLSEMIDVTIEILNFNYLQEKNLKFSNLLLDLFNDINDQINNVIIEVIM